MFYSATEGHPMRLLGWLPVLTTRARLEDRTLDAETDGYLRGHRTAWWAGYAQAFKDFPRVDAASAVADIKARIDAGPARARRAYSARVTPTGHILALVPAKEAAR